MGSTEWGYPLPDRRKALPEARCLLTRCTERLKWQSSALGSAEGILNVCDRLQGHLKDGLKFALCAGDLGRCALFGTVLFILPLPPAFGEDAIVLTGQLEHLI